MTKRAAATRAFVKRDGDGVAVQALRHQRKERQHEQPPDGDGAEEGPAIEEEQDQIGRKGDTAIRAAPQQYPPQQEAQAGIAEDGRQVVPGPEVEAEQPGRAGGGGQRPPPGSALHAE